MATLEATKLQSARHRQWPVAVLALALLIPILTRLREGSLAEIAAAQLHAPEVLIHLLLMAGALGLTKMASSGKTDTQGRGWSYHTALVVSIILGIAVLKSILELI